MPGLMVPLLPAVFEGLRDPDKEHAGLCCAVIESCAQVSVTPQPRPERKQTLALKGRARCQPKINI